LQLCDKVFKLTEKHAKKAEKDGQLQLLYYITPLIIAWSGQALFSFETGSLTFRTLDSFFRLIQAGLFMGTCLLLLIARIFLSR
jgi:hypothetical protein